MIPHSLGHITALTKQTATHLHITQSQHLMPQKTPSHSLTLISIIFIHSRVVSNGIPAPIHLYGQMNQVISASLELTRNIISIALICFCSSAGPIDQKPQTIVQPWCYLVINLHEEIGGAQWAFFMCKFQRKIATIS